MLRKVGQQTVFSFFTPTWPRSCVPLSDHVAEFPRERCAGCDLGRSAAKFVEIRKRIVRLLQQLPGSLSWRGSRCRRERGSLFRAVISWTVVLSNSVTHDGGLSLKASSTQFAPELAGIMATLLPALSQIFRMPIDLCGASG